MRPGRLLPLLVLFILGWTAAAEARRAKAELVHDTTGRMRVRVAHLRGDTAAAKAVRKDLGALPGVSSIEVSATTGTVLLHYDPATLRKEALLDALGDRFGAVARVQGALAPERSPAGEVVRQAALATGGKLLRRGAMSIAHEVFGDAAKSISPALSAVGAVRDVAQATRTMMDPRAPRGRKLGQVALGIASVVSCLPVPALRVVSAVVTRVVETALASGRWEPAR
jgi:hypothetical protein